MPGRARSNSFKVCAALLAGGAKALVAPQPPRARATALRAAMSDPEESPEACRARALTEEFSETKTSDDAVFAENGFYFVCQGIDLRNCPADQQLPMGQYELDLCKKHVGAHLCRRAQGSKRERNSQLQRLLSRPFSTRFG